MSHDSIGKLRGLCVVRTRSSEVLTRLSPVYFKVQNNSDPPSWQGLYRLRPGKIYPNKSTDHTRKMTISATALFQIHHAMKFRKGFSAHSSRHKRERTAKPQFGLLIRQVAFDPAASEGISMKTKVHSTNPSFRKRRYTTVGPARAPHRRSFMPWDCPAKRISHSRWSAWRPAGNEAGPPCQHLADAAGTSGARRSGPPSAKGNANEDSLHYHQSPTASPMGHQGKKRASLATRDLRLPNQSS